MTILLSTKIEIKKNPDWLGDEALRRGVSFSISRLNHHVNSMFVNSRTVAPGTSNLIAMQVKRTDLTAFSPENVDFLTPDSETCRSERDMFEANHR